MNICIVDPSNAEAQHDLPFLRKDREEALQAESALCRKLANEFEKRGQSVSVLSQFPSAEDPNAIEPEGQHSIFFGQPPVMRRAYAVYSWLKEKSFDLVILPCLSAAGYFALLAKEQGLSFANTTFCLLITEPTLHRRERLKEIPTRLEDLVEEFMERQSVQMAAAVISPSAMADWMRAEGWSYKQCLALSECDSDLTDRLLAVTPTKQNAPAAQQEYPLVSVAVIHYNRHNYLGQTLESIRNQDYPNFEVILVDDGSNDPETVKFLDALQSEFRSKNWQFIRQKNSYLGAARNRAARAARGEYILFMDDDNYAKPHEISTFVSVAAHTQADIVTSAMDIFSDSGCLETFDKVDYRWLYLGPALELGIFDNFFGDANALFRKRTFFELGGFTEERGTTWEDRELYAKAILKGCKLVAIPEALYFYRFSPDSMFRSTNRLANHFRALRPFFEVMPPLIQPAFPISLDFEAGNNKRSFDLRAEEEHLLQLETRLWHLRKEEEELSAQLGVTNA